MTLNARYNRASYIVGAFLLTIMSISAHAHEVPPLGTHVNDYAGMLSASTVRDLESKLVELDKSDSTQVVILIIDSLQGELLEEFSIKVAEKWKIGQKNLDNGVILLISKTDRKIRIEVGRGLEGKLTDLISGRIIRDEITPEFKRGDYDRGVAAGVSAIGSVVKGEYTSKSKSSAHLDFKTIFMISLLVLIVISVITMFVIAIFFFDKKSDWIFFGTISIFVEVGVLLICVGFVSEGILFIAIPVSIILFFIIVPLRYKGTGLGTSGGYRSSSSSWSSGGSSWSSGSSFSSGSSSSGYSGGGGSFGGGGASGSW